MNRLPHRAWHQPAPAMVRAASTVGAASAAMPSATAEQPTDTAEETHLLMPTRRSRRRRTGRRPVGGNLARRTAVRIGLAVGLARGRRRRSVLRLDGRTVAVLGTFAGTTTATTATAATLLRRAIGGHGLRGGGQVGHRFSDHHGLHRHFDRGSDGTGGGSDRIRTRRARTAFAATRALAAA